MKFYRNRDFVQYTFFLKRWSAATNLLALLENLLKDLLLAVEDDQVGLWHEDLLQHVSVPVLVVRKLLHHNTEVLRRNYCKLRTNLFGAPYLAFYLWNISQVIFTDGLVRGYCKCLLAGCATFHADAGVKLMCIWQCFYSLFTSIGPMVDVLPKISFKVIIESLSWEAKLCHVHLVLCNA